MIGRGGPTLSALALSCALVLAPSLAARAGLLGGAPFLPPPAVPAAAPEPVTRGIDSNATAPATPGPASERPDNATVPAAADVPAPAVAAAGVTPAAVTTPAATTPAVPAPKDELAEAGYLPGYRRARSLGLSPYAPEVGGMPGGVTPAYGAPTPSPGWSFKWNGFLSASLQTSMNRRAQPLAGQSETVFHVPPQTLDEYASFVGTNTMPGNWAALNFEYGNRVVTANFSINSWNPSEPATYYQIGSHYFINNAFLSFAIPRVAGIGLHANVGYFYNAYGALGQYGAGIYQNNITGIVRGVGETLVAERALGPGLSVVLEDGIMGTRNGKVPNGVVANGPSGGADPVFPAAWIHHLHLGVIKKGAPQIRAQLHYLTNWARDDRTQMATDNPTTRQIDESRPLDGRLTVWGADATVSSAVWGHLGVGVSYAKGNHAVGLRGLTTYGGEGLTLTERWWGQPTAGTGTLAVAAINYTVSIGKIVARPAPFNGDGPDLLLSTGLVIAKSTPGGGNFEPFDRVRHKYGLDLLYRFFPWMGAGIRGDRVVPSSIDSGETFHVIASRLVFKTDWQSRETITLLYAKWFYGPRSHPEASSSMAGGPLPGPGTPVPVGGQPEKLDDQLIALNVNMWW